MEILRRISVNDTLRAFDPLLSHGKIGSTRESILMHAESGVTYVPATITTTTIAPNITANTGQSG